MTLYGVELVQVADEEEAARVVAEELVTAARAGQAIVLTGGTSPGRAYELAVEDEPDWSGTELWWGDERCVPPEDERSNYRLARERLLDGLSAQPRKVHRSGLYETFEGQVLIYVHKEAELADVEAKYPARHYVMVDDKVRLLSAIKEYWGKRVTTVFPRQGHYALDAKLVAQYPTPDITLGRIGEFQKYSLDQIVAAGGRKEVGTSK